MNRRWVVLLAGMFLLAACGGSAAPARGKAPGPAHGGSSVAPAAQGANLLTYEGSDRQQKLLAAARKEGSVDWYTSLAGPVVEAVGQGFEKQYPFLHVSTYRAAENVLETHMIQGAQAGKATADVVESPLDAVLSLHGAGLVQPFYSPAAASIPAQFRVQAPAGSPAGTILAASDRVSYISFAYNKSLLSSAAVPKRIQDLTSPALRGKMEIESSTTGIRWVGSVFHVLGKAGAQSFFQAMAKQHVKVQAISGAAMMGLVANGQIAASPSVFHEHEQEQAAKGAPVAWLPMDPVTANVGMIFVAKNAPHPAAAALFADYILGSSVAPVYKKYLYLRPTVQVPFAKWVWVPEAGLTDAQYNAQYKVWLAAFHQAFAG